MPELPEVETVRRGLERLLIGRTITSASTLESPKSFPNNQADVDQFMIGAVVTGVRRRAKVLLIDLSTAYSLVVHLKMTGQLVYVKEGPAPPLDTEVNSSSSLHPLKRELSSRASGEVTSTKGRFGAGHPSDSLVGKLPDRSTRVVIEFSDDSHLYFNDQRKFGWMKLFPTLEIENIDFMKKVGPEPLEDEFTAQEFTPRIRRRNGTTVKAAILDQTVLAGVGNIYADESLWGARIHPAARVRDVSDEQLGQLLAHIKSVMNLSLEKGGSTDRNYLDAEGRRGSYLEFANVFRREGEPCRRHPDVLIEKSRVAGRGTHTCPVCQNL